MKKFCFTLIALVMLSGIAFAAAFTFSATNPGAETATLGENQKLEQQKAAIAEVRTKMEAWATFSGYSARSGR